MLESRSAVIVTHRYDAFDETPFLLAAIAKQWRATGHAVVVNNHPSIRMDADVAILHVNLTVVPQEYLAAAARYSRIINGRVLDISKRAISQQLVRSPAESDGPVIVKTDRNYGGYAEAMLADREPALQDSKRPPKCRLNYRVYRTAREAPATVWTDPDLVVERFLPERRDGYFCLRTWNFLGNRETGSISYSKQPIIKAGNVVHREPTTEIPDELRRMRRELGFDFGKFDYAIVDGNVVLYDANRTPALGNIRHFDVAPGVVQLAEGITSFI